MRYTVRDLVSVFILFEIVNFAGANRKHNVYCKNEKGQDVDWFVVYKLPKMQKSLDNYETPKGEEIAYYDSNNKHGKTKYWTRGTYDIYDPRNPVANTLRPLYEKQKKIKDLAYVAYNDQAPEGFNGTKGGHSKGILMVGTTNTVWLQHSVPRFPRLHHGEYRYPKNGRENAQLFLCVTFSAKESTDIIAQHLRVQYANVYQKHASPIILNKYPKFKLLYDGSYVTKKNESLFNDTLRSLGRQRLQSIDEARHLETRYIRCRGGSLHCRRTNLYSGKRGETVDRKSGDIILPEDLLRDERKDRNNYVRSTQKRYKSCSVIERTIASGQWPIKFTSSAFPLLIGWNPSTNGVAK
uniref:Putative deoxyribonuclease ii n=2 Tax=Ixodes ricinus TaxID=34613 RepID=V5H1F8_IXORI